jgi:hypothetical protein
VEHYFLQSNSSPVPTSIGKVKKSGWHFNFSTKKSTFS